MSRCFPYPPPGYEKNGIRDEALVESIKKLRREEKAKKDKEKKREKEEKDKVRENGDAGKEKRSHKKRHKDGKRQEGKKEGDNDKKRKLETENLEKSNLTEEHGQPAGSQNSSDSTFNSNKRHCSLPESCHNSGSIVRIRLPLQRHKDPEILPSKEQPYLASGRTHDALAQATCEPAFRHCIEEGEHHPCSTSTRNAGEEVKNFRLNKEKHCPTTKSVNLSQKVKSTPMLSTSTQLIKEKNCRIIKSVDLSPDVESIPTSSTSTQLSKEEHCPATKSIELSHKNKSVPMPSTSMHRPHLPVVSQFRDLFESWVPLPMQEECTEFGDETWLFESKQNRNSGVERCKDGSEILSYYEPSTLWPRAHFLPTADVFALPYATLF